MFITDMYSRIQKHTLNPFHMFLYVSYLDIFSKSRNKAKTVASLEFNVQSVSYAERKERSNTETL